MRSPLPKATSTNTNGESRGPQRRRRKAKRPEPEPLPANRVFKPVELLSDTDMDLIHRHSLELLRDVGLEFALPEAQDILAKAGAIVDRESGMVRFDPALVETHVAMAPSSFTIVARNPEKSIFFGGDSIAYGSAASTPNVIDGQGGRRPGNQADFQALVKLCHTLPTCQMMCGYPVEPIDVQVNTRHLHCNFDLLTLTDCAIRLYGIGRTRITDALEMVMLAHGIDRDTLKAAPRTVTVLNVNSPLKVDAPLLRGAIEMVRNGQAVVVSPVAFAGAMSPITVSGSLIQHNAECLGTIAFLQMVRAGSPVFYGSLYTNIDMKSGAPAMGTPDALIGAIATGQLGRRYDIPRRGFLGCSSNTVDAQAAYETMFALWASYLSGVNLVFHAHGYLESGLMTSFEKVVLDSELIAMMNALGRPVDLTDAEEAITAIKQAGPGGHFLDSAHTMSRYENAFHAPMLSDWRPYEFWHSDGAKDYAARAGGKWRELLESYEQPPIDPGVVEALTAYVARRKTEIGTSDI